MIEKNERMNDIGDGLLEGASQLLSFDNKFYNVKKKLMYYQEYQTIARKLQPSKDSHLSGMVSAITVNS
jgi:hypothetical protein